MAKDIPEGAGEWSLNLSGEEKEEFEKLRAQLASQISLVRRLRTALGLSQIEGAEALGTTQSIVSKIEATGDPSRSVVARAVRASVGEASASCSSGALMCAGSSR